MRPLPRLFLAAALSLLAPAAQAFCGFYVARADGDLFNKASMVVYTRAGDRSVITMSSDYRGDPAEFAMIGTEFKAACAATLPIRSRAQTVLLMHNVSGEWTVRRSFRLGRG